MIVLYGQVNLLEQCYLKLFEVFIFYLLCAYTLLLVTLSLYESYYINNYLIVIIVVVIHIFCFRVLIYLVLGLDRQIIIHMFTTKSTLIWLNRQKCRIKVYTCLQIGLSFQIPYQFFMCTSLAPWAWYIIMLVASCRFL